MEFNELSDKDLLKEIEIGDAVRELENSKTWKLIDEAFKRTAQYSHIKLISIDPTDVKGILRNQLRIELYSNVLGQIKTFKDYAEKMQKELDERKNDEQG